MNDRTPPDVPGADEVVSWFGYWPSFHDAEVLHLHLNRRGASRLSIHVWHMTDTTREHEGKRYFVREKHAIVTFELGDISDLDLSDFSAQNVLSSLHVERDGEVFRLRLNSSYGVGGRIDADQCSVSLEPGEPSGE